MDCRHIILQLDALRNGRLDAVWEGVMHRHLERCQPCRERAQQVPKVSSPHPSLASCELD